VHLLNITFPTGSLSDHRRRRITSSCCLSLFRFKTTVYDACFLALADLRGVPLVSADEKLIAQAKGFAGMIRLSDLSLK
jgi:hypothetical protein